MSQEMYVIYCLTNSVNGKKYVGQTKRTASARFAQHVTLSRSPKSSISAAIAKYGAGCFSIEILEEQVSAELVDEREVFYIAQLQTTTAGIGYNQTSGGQKYKQFTDEVKAKMSRSHLLRWNDEMKEAVRKRMTGNTFRRGSTASEGTKVRMSKSQTGRRHTKESKEKMALAKKREMADPERHASHVRNNVKRWKDPIFKERMRDVHLGSKRTEESRIRMSIAARNRKSKKEVAA